MPELPEVQSIVTVLKQGKENVPPVVGQVIESSVVRWQRTIVEPPANLFGGFIKGQTVVDAKRRGKFIHLPMDQGHLIVHLRMSGDLFMEEKPAKDADMPVRTHDRVELNFESNWRLVFNDPRKFGRMWLLDNPGTLFDHLGVEPFDENLTAERLFQMLAKSKKQVKTLLLDQTFLSGLGNIYSDEALFKAGIHPLRKANTIKTIEAELLLSSIRQVLGDAITRNGTSIDWVYRGGSFQDQLNVYQKDGNPCPVCGKLIERILVGQRGTHFCATCQPYFESETR